MNITDPAESVTTLELSTNGSDPVACACSVERGTGHTRYKLSGTRLYGVVTVIPAYDVDLVHPFTGRVRMQLGDCATDCATGHAAVRDNERDHPLTVNGVELAGAPVVNLTHVADPYGATPVDVGIGRWSSPLRRSDGGEVPPVTRHRLARLLAVLVDHWRTDPGNHTVRLAAARYAVRTGGYLDRKTAAIRQTHERLTELHAELDGHTRDLKRMELLRDSTDPDAVA